jgi:pyruvate kinase
VALLADLQGPKLRVGDLPNGQCEVRMSSELRLRAAASSNEPDVIPIPHPELVASLQLGDRLLIDDGKMMLHIVKVDGADRIARPVAPGRIMSRKGIAVPNRPIPIPALTEKDIADGKFALAHGVDYIALSFVQRAADLTLARGIFGAHVPLISKIEKPAALDELEEIVALSDAVMVARGDLGVELSPEQVPIAQRRIVRVARANGKPVIVATHMLESMVEALVPTRAEANDVATAVYQGADAVMLSAESAVGRHPTAAVAIMDRIIRAIEADRDANPSFPPPTPLARLRRRTPARAPRPSWRRSRLPAGRVHALGLIRPARVGHAPEATDPRSDAVNPHRPQAVAGLGCQRRHRAGGAALVRRHPRRRDAPRSGQPHQALRHHRRLSLRQRQFHRHDQGRGAEIGRRSRVG